MNVPSVWNQSMLGPAATLPDVTAEVESDVIPMAVSTVNLIDEIIGDPITETLTPDGVTLMLSDLPLGNTLNLFRNGVHLTEDVDYTIVDDEITLLVAPESEDAFQAVYVPEPEEE